MKLFGAATLFLLASCSPTTPSSGRAEAVRTRLVVGEFYEPVLNMTIDAGNGPRIGALITAAGDQALTLGKALVAGHQPVKGDIEFVSFTLLGKAGSDRVVGRKILHFTISGQALRQLAHIGANADTVLNDAREIGWWTPSNDDVVADYCSDRDKTGFCAHAT